MLDQQWGWMYCWGFLQHSLRFPPRHQHQEWKMHLWTPVKQLLEFLQVSLFHLLRAYMGETRKKKLLWYDCCCLEGGFRLSFVFHHCHPTKARTKIKHQIQQYTHQVFRKNIKTSKSLSSYLNSITEVPTNNRWNLMKKTESHCDGKQKRINQGGNFQNRIEQNHKKRLLEM